MTTKSAPPAKLVLPPLTCAAGHTAYGDPEHAGAPCPTCGEPLKAGE